MKKRPVTKKAKQAVETLTISAEVREVFRDAAKERGKESAFLRIRIQETGRAE